MFNGISCVKCHSQSCSATQNSSDHIITSLHILNKVFDNVNTELTCDKFFSNESTQIRTNGLNSFDQRKWKHVFRSCQKRFMTLIKSRIDCKEFC